MVLLFLLVRRLRGLLMSRGPGQDGPRGQAAPGAGPGGGGWMTADPSADALPIAQGVRFLVMVMVAVTVPLSRPHLGQGAQGTAITVALALSAAGWLTWLLARGRPRLWVGALIVMGVAGGALAGLSALSTAVAVGFVTTATAGARLPTVTSFAITAETVAALLGAGLAVGAPPEALIGWAAAFIGMWAFGLTRRAYLLRAEEAEQALDQARQAQEARAQTAALAERARIAREIHDVLAHSLAAVSVNLQAAEGLLGALPGNSPELAKAIECVERAGALTKEGMAEARRAILALREGGHPPAGGAAAERLASRLRALVDEHRADGGTAAGFAVTGQPRPVGAEAGLTVFRTAQEALTNARKHAPGQPVTVALGYSPADLTVQVSNPLAPRDADRPLAQTGAGYGLTGLRERAALIGGTLTARPEDGHWRVRLRIPEDEAGTPAPS